MKFRKRSFRQGFALIVTLTLLVLLTVVAVGLLGLSAISLRSTSQGSAMAEARANARLALMMAMGELQKQLGPDQRISARAGILDNAPASDEADDVANPHYLGVWDSWDTWLTDERGQLSIQDTYKRGRDPSLFRGWLVSHPEADKYETAIGSTPTGDMVVLCGEGSAGPDPAGHVMAARIPLRSGDRVTGSYAWWIDDESQKVRLDLPPRDDAGTIQSAQVVASHTGRPGIETMSEMAGFDISPEALAKMITTGEARISATNADRHFHDLTAYSLGLLTDVRSGGFKADLNLAFESETLPEEMDEARLFGGRPFDAPIRPMTGELSDITPQNPYVAPMSWRQLREHYRLYRGFSDSRIKQPVEWNRGAPFTRRYLMRGDTQAEWDTGGYARQLVLLRQTWVLATSSTRNPATPGGIEYYILAVPIVYLWNPYNITMKVDSKEVSSLGSMAYATGMRQKLYRGNTLVSDSLFPERDRDAQGNTFTGSNHNLTANQAGYRMIATGTGGSNPIDFRPGEVRVFSTDTEILHGTNLLGVGGGMNSRHFLATPGYTPIRDTGLLRGLKYRVYPGTGTGEVSLSLRLDDAQHCDNLYFGATRRSAISYNMQEVLVVGNGLVTENGTAVTKQTEGEWHDVVRTGVTSIDWVAPRELGSAWIVKDDPANRARWGTPGSPPMPIGIFSIVAKSAEQLVYDSGRASFAGDFRNRTWLHSPPTGLSNLLMNPVDLNRAGIAYQLHFRPVNGDQEVSQYLQADGPLGYFGGGYTPATGQTHLPMHSLPAAPAINLAAFAGVRIDHARARVVQEDDNFRNPMVNKSGLGNRLYKFKHLGHAGAAFGAGIGNSYAHPMIEPGNVYTRNDFGKDPGWDGSNTTNMAVCDDYWDHLFLANEGLWDSWFCSGIVPEVSNGRVTVPLRTVALDFFSDDNRNRTLVSRNFQPNRRGSTASELAELCGAAGRNGNGWELIGSYLFNKGQFNVNSTSKEAWKALLLGLRDRPVAVADAMTGNLSVTRDADSARVSRLPLANSEGQGGGPGDETAWRGIRSLTETQIDKLAGEIVRQVKLRGPFLNMTEFINRRLSSDATGVTGALQAAIDWDEFNAGYNGATSGSGESMNQDYKSGGAMITHGNLPAGYPNPMAATGSRYAGIPGYVMQSDILQGISNSLSVRGDTFLIRSYGESLSPDGRVAARAWCEAVVQRMPEYVDPADEADKKLRDPSQVPGTGTLSNLRPLNRTFGRKYHVVSFRWLNAEEI